MPLLPHLLPRSTLPSARTPASSRHQQTQREGRALGQEPLAERHEPVSAAICLRCSREQSPTTDGLAGAVGRRPGKLPVASVVDRRQDPPFCRAATVNDHSGCDPNLQGDAVMSDEKTGSEHDKARDLAEEALGAYAEGDEKKGDALAEKAIDRSAVVEVVEDLDEDTAATSKDA